MKNNELELPRLNALAPRKGEGQLLLTQNNEQKSVIITGTNTVLDALLGYGPEELIGRKVETLLGAQETKILADDLEYEENATDFGDIFSRLREVRLRRRNGEELRVECALSRVASLDRNACFQIIIPNENERMTSDRLRQFITLNLEGRTELDKATGLPNHKTAREVLPLLKNYLGDSKMNVVFAVLRLDRHEKSLSRYGREACVSLLMHVVNCCKVTFRADDMIFALSDRTLGVVLFDISRESSRVVFNRLRWRIRNQRFSFGGKPDFSISACIGFDMLLADTTEEVFARCEQKMIELDANERNALVELGVA